MRYALCALPLIGVVIGLAQALWQIAANWLCMPEMLRGAGLCLIPVQLTGGIHLDGYADTSDVLASCAPPEKKQEILKDPRCGAFAVIRLGVWLVASFALCTAVQLNGPALACFGMSFVLSRALSSWAVATFPLAKKTGLAHIFATSADRTAVRRVQKTALCWCGVTLLAQRADTVVRVFCGLPTLLKGELPE